MSQNLLHLETSPYLLQHADNPVHWMPWTAAALARAKAENKPIFLSVGYASCHWCHVMAHESFEDERAAEILNQHFISIKVDREERPDVDDIYMAATQLLTGRGGWPNSVWLLPDGRPFFAGTYFPREDRGGQPGFITLLKRIADLWANRRDDIEGQANELTDAIRQNAQAIARQPDAVTDDTLRAWRDAAIVELERSFDLRHGGFGSAPKFPPHSALALLLNEHSSGRHPSSATILTGTLDALQRGGIHDHIGGGFHRYSTDARWLVPHFEKMLYDSAQLAALYARASLQFNQPAYAKTARQTVEWILREMTDTKGGFYSGLDADSEGEEGRYYMWSADEIRQVLGPADAEYFSSRFGILPGGNFEDEATGRPTRLNIPHLPSASPEADDARLDDCRSRLLNARNARARPGLDDKVLASWNGLAISALATVGAALRDARYVEAAARAADFILRDMKQDGRLLHTSRGSSAKIGGFLDDHVFLADGLLDLHDATGEARFRDQALALVRHTVEAFWDPSDGGFFTTARDAEPLIARTKDAFDPATPSGNGVAARVLVRAGTTANNAEWIKMAGQTVKAFAPLLERAPSAACALLHAGAKYLDAVSAISE